MAKKKFNKTVTRAEMKKAWARKKGKRPSKAALSKAMKKAWR